MEPSNIKVLIAEVIRRKGGYSNHPADRGGPTNMGITQAVARQQGYTGDMRSLPRESAEQIYRRLYWHAPRFYDVAKVAPKLAAELFDTGINMGTGRAAGFLQRALNALNRNQKDYDDLKIDRQLGPKSLGALNRLLLKRGKEGEDVLIKAVEALQGAHYLRLAEKQPTQEAFIYGWLKNRIGNLGDEQNAVD